MEVRGSAGAGRDAVAEHVTDALGLTVQHGLVDGLVGGGVDLRGGGEHRAFLVIGERGAPHPVTRRGPKGMPCYRRVAVLWVASTSPIASQETSIEDPP